MEIKTAISQYVEYQQYFKNLSPMTIRSSKIEINFLAKQTNTTCLTEVTENVLHSYFLKGASQLNWKPKTIWVKRLVLGTFFKWCITKGFITANPIDAIPKPRIDQSLPIRLTKEQSLRLLDIVFHYPYKIGFIRYRNHAMLAICLYAGLRKMELFNLKFADVDIGNRSIFVRCGKGRKDRIIPMSHTLVEILSEYVRQRNKLKVQIPELFCVSSGKKAIDFNAFRGTLHGLRKLLGINFSLHKLRHTFATLMIEGGCDIYSLSKMMGHRSIMTTTIYLGATPEHLRSQMSKHPLG